VDNDEVAYDLFKRLLIYDPTIRIAARYALRHSYFSGYDPKKSLSAITNTKANQHPYDENNNLI
ncbi:unnamed protein product, partial [Rotaria sp. Silwood1]